MTISDNLRATLAAAAIVVAALGALLLAAAPVTRASAQPPVGPGPIEPGVGPDRVRVVDGHTLQDIEADTVYRLVNIDTPETGDRARCAAERELGERATNTARMLVMRARRLEFRPTGRVDDYGRSVAHIIVDGRDLGETLVGRGLARPWRGRREPWCDASGNLIR